MAETVGDRIKELRKQYGYRSQEDLAEALDMDRSYISLIETDKSKPSWRFIVAFANLLRIAPDELLRKAGYVDTEREPPADIIEEISVDPDAVEVLEFLKDYPQKRRAVARFIRDFLKGELEEERGASRGPEPSRQPTPENTG